MMSRLCLPTILLLVAAFSLSCTQNKPQPTMTAADEEAYAIAIEREDAKQAPKVALAESIVVGIGPKSQGDDSQLPVDLTAPQVKRQIDVLQNNYEAFFAEGPAVVLGRLELEPVRDGSELLGYRITNIRETFEGVDLMEDDIIVGINGTLPKNPDQYFEQWQKLQQYKAPVRLQVQRKLDRFEIVWSVK